MHMHMRPLGWGGLPLLALVVPALSAAPLPPLSPPCLSPPQPPPSRSSNCDFSLGCASNWMGADDGCDCWENGRECETDSDCPSGATKTRPSSSAYHACNMITTRPLGLALDFEPYGTQDLDTPQDLDTNLLGGHEGNRDKVNCTTVGTLGDNCPCGCGCNCTLPGVEGSGDASEMRLRKVGYTFNGSDVAQEIDLVVKNVTAYTPWDSRQNGRYSTVDGNGTEFAQVSLKAGTSTTFEYRFVNTGTDDSADVAGSFDFCFFDFDTGLHHDNGTIDLQESLEACGFVDFYHHGRRPNVSGVSSPWVDEPPKIQHGLCDSEINTTEYMDINVTDNCIKASFPAHSH